MSFPQGFVWGAATASYQIEGAALEDGRGECIWTRYSHTPGMVQDGDTGDVACDHYHRYKDDVKLMTELGLQAYRFSVSWPRVFPKGTHTVNELGLDFYNRLVDELLEAGITPFLTLYHWDLPQVLQDLGGWENPDSVKWFADYTDLMARTLGDRVKFWATHNEPWVVAFVGNFIGRHAPGKQDFRAALKVAHHLLLAHGAAVPVIREHVPDAQVGIVLNYNIAVAGSDNPKDIQAARYNDGYIHRWFLDPLYKGAYPEDMVELYGSQLDGIDLEAVKAAAVPMEWLGINYYTRNKVKWADNTPIPVEHIIEPELGLTEMGWEFYPQGMTDTLNNVREAYAPKSIYITENGSSYPDPEPVNGRVHDPKRVAYLVAHLKALETAIDAGVPVRGYFAWSLMDNFEWGFGYSKRFGLIAVDYATQTRTYKDTAVRYQEIIRANAVIE